MGYSLVVKTIFTGDCFTCFIIALIVIAIGAYILVDWIKRGQPW